MEVRDDRIFDGKTGPMNYVIAAYGLVAATIVGYGLHLHRERRRLRDLIGDSWAEHEQDSA